MQSWFVLASQSCSDLTCKFEFISFDVSIADCNLLGIVIENILSITFQIKLRLERLICVPNARHWRITSWQYGIAICIGVRTVDIIDHLLIYVENLVS